MCFFLTVSVAIGSVPEIVSVVPSLDFNSLLLQQDEEIRERESLVTYNSTRVPSRKRYVC